MGNLQLHLGLLHGLEQSPLDSRAGDIRANQVGGGGNLVHFIQINDPVLSELDISVGFIDQVAHQVLHIATDITCFAKLGSVAFDKGHADLLGDELHQESLANSCGPNHDNVILDLSYALMPVIPMRQLEHFNPVEMGAYLGSQDLLGLFLFDKVFVQVRFQLLGLHVEMDGQRLALFFLFSFSDLLSFGFRDWAEPGKLNPSPVLLGQIVAQILLDLLNIQILFHDFYNPSKPLQLVIIIILFRRPCQLSDWSLRRSPLFP